MRMIPKGMRTRKRSERICLWAIASLGSYGLRPGVLLQIAIREDLYDRFVASQE